MLRDRVRARQQLSMLPCGANFPALDSHKGYEGEDPAAFHGVALSFSRQRNKGRRKQAAKIARRRLGGRDSRPQFAEHIRPVGKQKRDEQLTRGAGKWAAGWASSTYPFRQLERR